MADRGWSNRETLARHSVRLITPAFLLDQKQLDLPALVQSVSIAMVRIHVERCIGGIKMWKILTRQTQLSEWKALNTIWKVCAHLVVFWPPLLLSDTNILGAHDTTICTVIDNIFTALFHNYLWRLSCIILIEFLSTEVVQRMQSANVYSYIA